MALCMTEILRASALSCPVGKVFRGDFHRLIHAAAIGPGFRIFIHFTLSDLPATFLVLRAACTMGHHERSEGGCDGGAIVAAEADACGPFKHKIMEPSHRMGWGWPSQNAIVRHCKGDPVS